MSLSDRVCLTFLMFTTTTSHNTLISIPVAISQMVDVPAYGKVKTFSTHFNFVLHYA